MPKNETTSLLAGLGKQDQATSHPPRLGNEPLNITKEPIYGSCDSTSKLRRRPVLNLAASSSAAVAHENPTPLLSRPLMSALTPNMTALLRSIMHRTPKSQFSNQCPSSLLRRATDTASSALGVTSATRQIEYRNPSVPTYLTEYVHKATLLDIWDALIRHNDTLQANRQNPVSATVVEIRRQMVRKFPELGNGEVMLEHDWIEFILGTNMRRPWWKLEYMSRWEVVVSSNGARANWGPW